MKKSLFSGLVIGLFLVLMISSFVVAQTSGEEAGNDFVGFFSTIFAGIGGLLNFEGATDGITSFFLGFLLILIVYSVIATMIDNNYLRWGISFAITVLALIGIPEGMLSAITTQYGAMGAAILTIIPFAIILLFSLRTDSLVLARLTWIFYTMYYFGFYLIRIISGGERGFASGDNWIYLIAMLVGAGVFFGIKAIRELMFKGKIEGLEESGSKYAKRKAALKKLNEEELDAYG